ncbi:MAG: polysaccharide deacetylase family protein, partial [Selenomonadaceae bacterium]|nr:polysaccharide deacetylase family protein [Selenomonadaceae bacterium]
MISLLVALFAAIIFLLPEPEGFPILEYHQVTDEKLDPDFEVYNVPPEEFSAQLDFLQAEGYTTITLQDFMRAVHGKATLPDKPIVLTFDDGYTDNYSTMLPIL